MAKWGRIDILLNIAGGNMPGATLAPDQHFYDMDISCWEKVTNLNMNGTVYPSLVFSKVMAKQGKGCIVNVSSMAAYSAITRVPGYSAAKTAVANFTQWLASELALKYGDGIRVNAIAPGFFIGDQNRAVLINPDGSLTDRSKKVLAKTPMKRFGDINELNGLVSSAMSADGEVQAPETDADFTYSDALSCTFKVLSPSDTYRKNDETGGWTDMSDDAEFMASKVKDGLDLRIVGVVKPNGTGNSQALSPGVAYTHGLTCELMARAAGSQIVRQQLADPDTDVFTGKSFDELQKDAKKGFDLQSMFSVDEDAMRSAFRFDASALAALPSAGNIDMGGLNLSGIDVSGLDIDLSGIGADLDFSDILANAPAPDFSGIFDGLELTPDQMRQGAALAKQLLSDFLSSDEFKGLGEDVKDAGKLAAAFKAYLTENPKAQETLKALGDLGGNAFVERIQKALSDYVSGSLAPYLQSVVDEVTKRVGDEISAAVSAQVKAGLAQAFDQAATQMGAAMADAAAQMSGSLASLQDAFSVDGAAFASAIHFNMDASDLSSLMSSYANASRLTYDSNLSTLGYADEADPQSVKIYPKDFDAKERVLGHIDAYNDQAKAEGEDERAIVYTDYMGVIMGSVTDIVNMISMVLIAFVSISLVVSSIMIGIITYISVLERKKEIGILRAIGASRRNVANVFNAETFIEGLISGVFAILVVVLVSLPVNDLVLRLKGVPNIMSLPWEAALALICISVALTVVAGLLPARSASKKDPVEALRSE